jgi:hypothetical protein
VTVVRFAQILKVEVTNMRKIFNNKMWILVLLLAISITGCGRNHDDGGGTGTAGSVCTGANCVSLGTAGDLAAAGGYVILGETAITNTGTTAITGNVGISPNKAGSIAGFGLVADATNVFSTSSLVTGKIYASDYAVPTPANLTTAVASMQAAYTDAAGRAAGVGPNLNLGGGTVGVNNLAPGTYTWGTPVHITGDITLTGTATDIWIFQIAGTLVQDSAMKIILAGGALPQNVFWQVSGNVTIGTNAHIEGIILGQTLIALQTGASMKGRALAQTAVTLDSNAITVP